MSEDRLVNRITDIYATLPHQMMAYIVCLDHEEYKDVASYLEMHESNNIQTMAFGYATLQLNGRRIANLAAATLRKGIIPYETIRPNEIVYLSFKTAEYVMAKIAAQNPTAKHRYGCHNRDRPLKGTALEVQSGWQDIKLSTGSPQTVVTEVVRVPQMTTVPFVMTEACMYDKSNSDSACCDCIHRRT